MFPLTPALTPLSECFINTSRSTLNTVLSLLGSQSTGFSLSVPTSDKIWTVVYLHLDSSCQFYNCRYNRNKIEPETRPNTVHSAGEE